MTATGSERTAGSCVRRGLGWVLGTGSSQKGGQALEQAHHGNGHGPVMLEFMKCSDKSVRHKVSFWLVLRGARDWTR